MQAAVLGAACVERASGILFLTVSRGGREGDIEIYRKALEFIWQASLHPDATPPLAAGGIEGLREFVVGDEATMGAAFALHPAIAIRGMLKFHESSDKSAVHDCLLACHNQAYFLGRRSGSNVLGVEEASLLRDVSELSRSPEPSPEVLAQLRLDAQSVAHDRLEVVIARYGN
jgi:hypothetical protein